MAATHAAPSTPPTAPPSPTIEAPTPPAAKAAAAGNTGQAPRAADAETKKRVRKAPAVPTSELLQRLPARLSACTVSNVRSLMTSVSDKTNAASHVRAVKQMVSVKTYTKKQVTAIEKYIQKTLKEKHTLDVPACFEALLAHFRQQDCSAVSGKYIACGVKHLMSAADVHDTNVESLPLDEAKRLLPAVALVRAAKEQGFQPVAVCNDKKVNDAYVVQSDGTVPSTAQLLHVARSKSFVSNGHTDALTVWNATAQCYPTKPVPRVLNGPQRRVLDAVHNMKLALALNNAVEAPATSGAAQPAAAAPPAAACSDGPARKPASAVKRPRDDDEPAQDDDAPAPSPKKQAAE